MKVRLPYTCGQQSRAAHLARNRQPKRQNLAAKPVSLPTEEAALRMSATVDDFARAAMAEIERREGYEGELLTALENCRKPVSAETVAETMRKPIQNHS